MASYRGTSRGFGTRGSWRGQDSQTRTSTRSRAENLQLPTPTPPRPFGPTIDSVNSKTLLIEEDAPTIRDVEYVASYNWLDGKSPIILVPGQYLAFCVNPYRYPIPPANMPNHAGSPPAWTPPVEDLQLKPDSGAVFRDINAARYPSYPLEPVFRSLKAMQPQFDLQSVDIVGCGSTIGNLLRFAGSQSKPFRFDIDVVEDTVLFVRKESSPTELITDLRGYGHTFPESYTTWDPEVRNSCSHQRVVRYEFGGLKFLVRSETDGYVRGPGQDKPNVGRSTEPLSLDDALGIASLSPSVVDAGHELEVRLQGVKIPQNMIFDLKTRASNRTFDMEDILPRLWVNQTSKFLIAYHKFGVFNQPRVANVRQQVLNWESGNSALLARFHAVVKRIVDVIRDSEDQQCEVSWDGQGSLYITKQIGEGRRALPFNVVQSFEVCGKV